MYVGRFAPSPTGPLHAGSLVAALASWLDARAHGGRWLVRIEDVDTPRCIPGADELILQQLARCGLVSDGPVWRQSQRHAVYQAALQDLVGAGLAYPCSCSRKTIELNLLAAGWQPQRHAERPYPGTCRPRSQSLPGAATLNAWPKHAWRLRTDSLGQTTNFIHWSDRRLGAQCQELSREVGDFVLKRADGLWAYQLAVVVDDAAQGISHVVRGEDLADNTPRQLWLHKCLGLAGPSYLHTPLVMAADGQKLSKQNGATALDLNEPLRALRQAAQVLGLPADLWRETGELPANAALMSAPGLSLAAWLEQAVAAWARRWLLV